MFFELWPQVYLDQPQSKDQLVLGHESVVGSSVNTDEQFSVDNVLSLFAF